MSKTDREKLKRASHELLAKLQELLWPMHDWTQNAATQAEVRVAILDSLWGMLPREAFDEAETELLSGRVYDYVWERSVSGPGLVAA